MVDGGAAITNALACTHIASPFSGGWWTAPWLAWALVALGAAVCVVLVALFFVHGVSLRVRGAALSLTLCCTLTVLAIVLIVPRASNPGRATPTSKTLRELDGFNNLGIAFSGGSLSGGLDCVCFLHQLDKLVDGKLSSSRSTRIAISSVSAGGLGYLAWRNLNIAFPELTPNWTAPELQAWPPAESMPPGRRPFSAIPLLVAALPELVETARKCLGGDVDACNDILGEADDEDRAGAAAQALASAFGSAAASPAVTAREVVRTIKALLECLDNEAPWPCAAAALCVVQGVKDPKTAPPGPVRWLVQFSILNAFSGPFGGAGVPLPLEGFEWDAALGTLDNDPERDEPTLSSTPAFLPEGRRLHAGLSGVAERWVLPALDSAEPVDLFSALGYSSDFLSMFTPFVDASTGATCPFRMIDDVILSTIGEEATPEEQCEMRSRWRQQYTASQSLLGSWPARPARGGLAADGGTLEVQGLVSLLRVKARNVIAFYELAVPFTQNPRLGLLFGQRAVLRDLCHSGLPGARLLRQVLPRGRRERRRARCGRESRAPCPTPSRSACRAAMGPELQQVFDASLWPRVRTALFDRAGPNSVVLKNVRVRRNTFWGVEAYTIRTLLIVSNGPSAQFNAYMEGADGEQPDASSPPPIAPPAWAPFLPPTFPSILGFGITPFQANAKCLLAQWKVQHQAELIKRLLEGVL